ncbi:MAG: oligosaccharide flippase family protein [Edaphobacter sp.]|uniref:lipopolysaccharide biosynthesis protein n=1 Tax=Edaphobacter sp. TaxID=1934404 RepID=UPI0023A058F4|nr:oligosaccharide flippase family protein [Edaphobacter sp.]MDE1175570.1 oligosaccharide flippase family protein [Edaphobacter sp.]
MIDSLLTAEPPVNEVLIETVAEEASSAPESHAVSREVTRHILAGTSTLGIAVVIERGATFAANIMSARFAGAAVFGAFSVGISTANNISTYAAGGIGATATRFSGKYPYGSDRYTTFAQVLGSISLISAAVAACVLFFGAPLIAHVLHKESLTGLLRWASLPAAGMLLLECARGFFVGQRRLLALALLSLLVGIGMVAFLPAAALSKAPARMVATHGAVTLSAVIVCLVLAKPLGLLIKGSGSPTHFASMLREVWGFGLIQLSGLLSANLAGWWITALVARGDSTLVEMGFFAIASQLRNLTGILPALMTEGSYAAIASPDEEHTHMPQRVMALCTFASTAVSFTLASLGIILIPWMLRLVYGPRYAGASVAAAIGMSVAVLQMSNTPPSARVSVVSIKAVAAINTLWAVLTAAGGTLLMLRWGDAAGAMAVFFLAHVITSCLIFLVLARKDHLPKGLLSLFALSTGGVIALSALAVLRERLGDHSLSITAAMCLIAILCTCILYLLAKKHAWMSSLSSIRTHLSSLTATVRGFVLKAAGRKASL